MTSVLCLVAQLEDNFFFRRSPDAVAFRVVMSFCALSVVGLVTLEIGV